MKTKDYIGSHFLKWKRFSLWQLNLMALHKRVQFKTLYYHEKFCGLVYYVAGKQIIYLVKGKSKGINEDIGGVS
ncbi:hypothetical protein PT287_07515 [Lactobacillus sp. ESL0679]|uniref:hypothetical protein n=1 Tax=Lactobacillus sp. ESL0679 TaxID=2983209 RepID=UPI0023FA1613|nr:hypothetical protein [Lactobacillus sp. ESL0679]MDF7683348.1 hypothetical protein [Lactobacillus sp. ESL0679]